ncbi:hypothetical protein EGW08_000843, partial [Elysia chlorotica]
DLLSKGTTTDPPVFSSTDSSTVSATPSLSVCDVSMLDAPPLCPVPDGSRLGSMGSPSSSELGLGVALSSPAFCSLEPAPSSPDGVISLSSVLGSASPVGDSPSGTGESFSSVLEEALGSGFPAGISPSGYGVSSSSESDEALGSGFPAGISPSGYGVSFSSVSDEALGSASGLVVAPASSIPVSTTSGEALSLSVTSPSSTSGPSVGTYEPASGDISPFPVFSSIAVSSPSPAAPPVGVVSGTVWSPSPSVPSPCASPPPTDPVPSIPGLFVSLGASV